MKRPIRIGVIGGHSATAKELAAAREVGRCIAEAGAVLVCGGLGGIMEAACQGAKEAGGTTVGVLPGRNAQSANRFVDIPIVTDMGYARNVIVVLSSQAAIAISGRYGTLSEIAHARNYGIPVVGLGTWDLNKIDKQRGLRVAKDAQGAVALALQAPSR